MAEFKAGARKREPTHPGKIIASSLKALNTSPRQAALAIGVTSQALGNVINAKSAVTPEMALRLGKYFGNGPQLWLGLQADVDLWMAERAIGASVEKIKTAKVA